MLLTFHLLIKQNSTLFVGSYQAVECFLANVQPVHPLEGGQWNHNSINKFEEITHGKFVIQKFNEMNGGAKLPNFVLICMLNVLEKVFHTNVYLNNVPMEAPVDSKIMKKEFEFVFISVAKWKKLLAKTVKTRERFRGIETSTTESSTIPGLELYDTIDGKFILNYHLITNELFHYNSEIGWVFK